MTTTLSRPPAEPARTASPPPGRRRFRGHHAALLALLAATAVLYLWGLSESGWANAFYSAAAQAGAASWKAWFFGSSDSANAITVDKTPGALWITGLSVRIFGLSSWSILVPQALMGVASVGLLHATVRRSAGPAAGLLAGAALALTPVAVLMFRFNNPDALLTLLLIGSAYATLRAIEAGRTRWLVLAATLIGFGFLTKMLQAFLVVPALAAVWLIAAPVGIGRRLRALLLAALALVVSGGWWVLVVELWPASSRPYIGGSQTNSVLELVFGYNGFGRLTGDEVGSVGGGAGGVTGGWGETGLLRLFNGEFGGQASWLIPAALVLLVALLWRTLRAPRTDPLRAAAVLWGGWLLVTAAVFSLMAGIFHGYYLVALAPAIAALVGIGAGVLWRDRGSLVPRAVLAAVVVVTAVWAFVLLQRTPEWQAWLSWTVLGAGILAALALLVVHRVPRVVAAGVAATAMIAGLAGPAAYSVETAALPHTGAIPTAGPQGAALRTAGFGGGFGGFGGGQGQFGRPPGTTFGNAQQAPPGSGTAGGNGFGRRARSGATPGITGTGPSGGSNSGSGTSGGGTFGGGTFGGGAPGGGNSGSGTPGGTIGNGTGGAGGPGAGGRAGGRFGGGGFGGMGGLLDSPTPDAAVVALLQEDAAQYTWVAATVGSNDAAGYQLASGGPVMALGGFNGTDPFPTLQAFQQLVADGRVHWFVGGDGPGGTASGGSDVAQEIAGWVADTFTPQTVGGTTMYDLSAR